MLIRQIDNKADRHHASYKITYKIRFYIMFTGNFYTSVKNLVYIFLTLFICLIEENGMLYLLIWNDNYRKAVVFLTL